MKIITMNLTTDMTISYENNTPTNDTSIVSASESVKTVVETRMCEVCYTIATGENSDGLQYCNYHLLDE